MRILMLNYEFPPLGGGAGNATKYLLKEFEKDKEIVIDLVTSSTGKYRKESFSDNIQVHYLNIGKKGNMLYQSIKDLLIYSWKAYWYSKKLIRLNNFNLIHAFFGIPCGYIAMKLSLPYIVSLRGSDVPGHNPKYRMLDRILLQTLSQKIWSRAIHVVTNSIDLANEARLTASCQKYKVICNGVDIELFYEKERKLVKKFVILFVGRFSKVKGLSHLIEAFSKLNVTNKLLILVGDGDMKHSLIQYAKELKVEQQIIFPGPQWGKDLIYYYHLSDIFVLPSLNEGMSNTVLEAMACGLPIITTNTGGSKELINGNGFIVAKASSESIKNELNKYINNPDLIISHGVQSRKMAEKMSWSQVAESYKRLYK